MRKVVNDPLAGLKGGVARPVTAPRDTFMNPTVQQDQPTMANLGQALGVAAKGVANAFDGMAAADAAQLEADNEAALAKGEMAFAQLRKRLGDAVRSGALPPGMSPAFKDGYLKAQLEEQGALYSEFLERQHEANPAMADDPTEYAAWEAEQFQAFGEANFADSEATDREILDHFNDKRLKAAEEIRNKILQREATDLEAKRESLFEQQTTRTFTQLASGKLDTKEAAEILSKYGADYYETAPTPDVGKRINKVMLNQLYHVAVEQRSLKVLEAARHIKTGTGTLAGTAAYRDTIAKTRDKITTILKAEESQTSWQDKARAKAILEDPRFSFEAGGKAPEAMDKAMIDTLVQSGHVSEGAAATAWVKNQNAIKEYKRIVQAATDFVNEQVVPTDDADLDAVYKHLSANGMDHNARAALVGAAGRIPSAMRQEMDTWLHSSDAEEVTKWFEMRRIIEAQNPLLLSQQGGNSENDELMLVAQAAARVGLKGRAQSMGELIIQMRGQGINAKEALASHMKGMNRQDKARFYKDVAKKAGTDLKTQKRAERILGHLLASGADGAAAQEAVINIMAAQTIEISDNISLPPGAVMPQGIRDANPEDIKAVIAEGVTFARTMVGDDEGTVLQLAEGQLAVMNRTTGEIQPIDSRILAQKAKALQIARTDALNDQRELRKQDADRRVDEAVTRRAAEQQRIVKLGEDRKKAAEGYKKAQEQEARDDGVLTASKKAWFGSRKSKNPKVKAPIATEYLNTDARRRLKEEGKTVVSFDTNSIGRPHTFEPLVVVPDDASPEMRKMAQEWVKRVALEVSRKTGKKFKGRVVKRSENKGADGKARGRSNTIHLEPYGVNDEANIDGMSATEYWSKGPGMKIIADITRSTFGSTENAVLTSPHGNGKPGAVGPHGSEVELAAPLLEALGAK